MLKLLFSSEARVKLLNLLLLHSDKEYSVSQLASELKLSTAQINKELTNLIQFGLISEAFIEIEKIDNEESTEITTAAKKVSTNKKEAERVKAKKNTSTAKRVFSVNQNFILYPEIKSLFIKAQILSSQNFILNLKKAFSIKLLLLTGFFTNDAEAPTDLLIVGGIKRPAFLKLITELENDLGREINFTILDEREFFYRQEIMDIFLYNILEGKKIVLIDNLPDK